MTAVTTVSGIDFAIINVLESNLPSDTFVNSKKELPVSSKFLTQDNCLRNRLYDTFVVQ